MRCKEPIPWGWCQKISIMRMKQSLNFFFNLTSLKFWQHFVGVPKSLNGLFFTHANLSPNLEISADLSSTPPPSLWSALPKTMPTSSNWNLLCSYCTRQRSASSQENVNITFSAFLWLRHANVSPGPLNIKEAKSWGGKERMEGEWREAVVSFCLFLLLLWVSPKCGDGSDN